MVERLGVRSLWQDQGALLPLKRPSRHLGVGQCEDTSRMKVKSMRICEGWKRQGHAGHAGDRPREFAPLPPPPDPS